MKAHLKSIFGDVVFYGAIGTASRLASIFVTPIVVRVFDAAEYGVVDALRVLGLALSGLALFALEQAAARNISVEDDKEKKKIIAGQALATAGVSALTVMIAVSLNAHAIARWLFDAASSDVVLSLHLIVLSIPGSVCNAFALMLLRWNFRRKAYASCAVGGTILLLAATLYFVVYLKLGLIGVFIAQLLSSILPILILTIYCRKHVAMKRQFAGWRFLKFAFPLSLITQASNLQPMLERMVILRLIGLEGLGIFSVAQAAAKAGKFPADSLYMAWYPYYSQLFREKVANSLELVLLVLYAVLSIIYVAGVHFLSEQIIGIFAGAAYLQSAQLLAIILGGYLFEAGASLVGIKVLLVGHTGRWAALYFLQGLIFVALSFLLANSMGLVGIGYAFLCSRVLYFGMACLKSYLVSNKVRSIAS